MEKTGAFWKYHGVQQTVYIIFSVIFFKSTTSVAPCGLKDGSIHVIDCLSLTVQQVAAYTVFEQTAFGLL